jgi:hypothetical protein
MNTLETRTVIPDLNSVVVAIPPGDLQVVDREVVEPIGPLVIVVGNNRLVHDETDETIGNRGHPAYFVRERNPRNGLVSIVRMIARAAAMPIHMVKPAAIQYSRATNYAILFTPPSVSQQSLNVITTSPEGLTVRIGGAS